MTKAQRDKRGLLAEFAREPLIPIAAWWFTPPPESALDLPSDGDYRECCGCIVQILYVEERHDDMFWDGTSYVCRLVEW